MLLIEDLHCRMVTMETYRSPHVYHLIS